MLGMPLAGFGAGIAAWSLITPSSPRASIGKMATFDFFAVLISFMSSA